MAVSIPEQFRPLRRVEYDKLVALGMFANEKIELMYGVLVPMSPIGAPHSSAVQKLCAILVPALLGRACVRPQSPFAALDLSEPEPDVVVAPSGDYDTAHPDEAYLIVEVADSSLPYDRGPKLRLYATCGVPEYWIVNLSDRCIEVFTEPEGEAYRAARTFVRGEGVRLTQFPDVFVGVGDVMK